MAGSKGRGSTTAQVKSPIGKKLGVVTGAPKPHGTTKSRLAGLKGAIGTHINKPNLKKAAVNSLKWGGRKFRRGVATAAGTALLLPFAGAAALTNPEKAAQYLGASVLAGHAVGNKAGDKLTKMEKQSREAYKETKWGTDEYNTRNAIKEMEENPEFLKTAKSLGLNGKQRRDLVRQYRANGVTDQDKILNAMATQQRLNVPEDNAAGNKERAKMLGLKKPQKRITNDEMIAAQQISQQYGASFWTNPDNQNKIRKRLINKNGLTQNQADRAIALVSALKGDLS